MDEETMKALADALDAWLEDDTEWDKVYAIEDERAADRAAAEHFAGCLTKFGLKVVRV